MKNIILILVVLAVLIPVGAMAENITLVPEHGSLWRVAEEFGQPGAAWKEIWAKNPWLKIKLVKGKKIPVVHPGQPILLPENWIPEQAEAKQVDIFGAIWLEYRQMIEEHTFPMIFIILFIVGIIAAKTTSGNHGKKRPVPALAVIQPRSKFGRSK